MDVAIQREGLARRAKRLVVMDVDSTIIQDEVIDVVRRINADPAWHGQIVQKLDEFVAA